MNGYLFILRLPLTSILFRIDIINMNGINSYGYSYLFRAGAVIEDIEKWLWVLIPCPSNVSHLIHMTVIMLISQTSMSLCYEPGVKETDIKMSFFLKEFKSKLS